VSVWQLALYLASFPDHLGKAVLVSFLRACHIDGKNRASACAQQKHLLSVDRGDCTGMSQHRYIFVNNPPQGHEQFLKFWKRFLDVGFQSNKTLEILQT
jgi:hypothetical protein